jgi:hypothetical protein
MYNGPIIMSDSAKINKEKRKKIRIPMIMDEIDDRINKFSTRDGGRSKKI